MTETNNLESAPVNDKIYWRNRKSVFGTSFAAPPFSTKDSSTTIDQQAASSSEEDRQSYKESLESWLTEYKTLTDAGNVALTLGFVVVVAA